MVPLRANEQQTTPLAPYKYADLHLWKFKNIKANKLKLPDTGGVRVYSHHHHTWHIDANLLNYIRISNSRDEYTLETLAPRVRQANKTQRAHADKFTFLFCVVFFLGGSKT